MAAGVFGAWGLSESGEGGGGNLGDAPAWVRGPGSKMGESLATYSRRLDSAGLRGGV